MKRAYAEVVCDQCGQADHYKGSNVNEQAKNNGWLIDGRKHFCDAQCKSNWHAAHPSRGAKP